MPKVLFRTVIAWMIVLACFCQGCYNTPQQVTLPPTKLSAVDLQFGRQQVDQMMRDRGEMASCVQKSDIIYEWAARQFGGEGAGHRVYWNPELPACGNDCLANNTPPYGTDKTGFIRIREYYPDEARKGQPIPCEELWACTVFELYNMSYGKEQASNYENALQGRISREEYILNTASIEFKAVKRTGEFYRSVWAPWAKNKNIEMRSPHWYADEPESYDEWIKQYNDPSGYPYSEYGNEYDTEIAPQVKR